MPASTTQRISITGLSLLGLTLGGIASSAFAQPRDPKPETVTVSARAMKDETSKLCMPHQDSTTRKTTTMCLTRDG